MDTAQRIRDLRQALGTVKMLGDEMNDDYKEKLEDGLKFQEFACRVLADNGISTIPLYGKDNGQIGDTTGGFEVKFNRGIVENDAVVIETHEKQPDADRWIESGILRKDDTWAWVMGDYDRLILWSKRRLLLACKSGKLAPYETGTSKGFILKWAMAKAGADKVLLDRSES